MIRVDTITELVDTGLLLARQPLPTGPRVAILGNSESLGLLTYDACVSEGLRQAHPLDLTTAASPDDFHAALARALADDDCDAVIVTAIPAVGESVAGVSGTAGPTGDAALAEALRSAAERVPGKPVLVVHVELGGLAEALSAAASTAPSTMPGAVPRNTGGEATPSPAPAPGAIRADHPFRALDRLRAPATSGAHLPGLQSATAPRLIPAYPAAERAVRALADAVQYAQWRREATEPGKVPDYEDIDEKGAATLIDGLLTRGQGLTLGTEETCELLGRYGVQVHRALPAPTPDAAAEAARTLGYPVALKATAPHLRHRADLGGVRLDLADEEQLRRAYAELRELFGTPDELRPVVQGMAPRGVDTVIRAVIDPAMRRRALLRARRGGLAAARGHRAPADSGHRPGGVDPRPIDPDRTAPLRLARVHAGRHTRPGGAPAAGVPAGRRPSRGRRGHPGAGRRRPARSERPRRLRTARAAARPRRPRPADAPRVLSCGERCLAAGAPP